MAWKKETTTFKPTGGGCLMPKEKLSFTNHNVKPSSCSLVRASVTRGMKALKFLPNTYRDTHTHTRMQTTPLAGNFPSQYPVISAAAPRVPEAFWFCLKCNKPSLSSYMSQMGNLSLTSLEREGTSQRDQSQEAEKCTKTWICRKGKCMAHTQKALF